MSLIAHFREATTLLICLALGVIPATVLACQPCTTFQLGSTRLRIERMDQTGQEKPQVVGAEVRIRDVISLPAGKTGRQELSCLASSEIGKVIISGKTDKHGEFNLKKLAPGLYWLAVRGNGLQGVWMIEVTAQSRTARDLETFTINESGVVPIRATLSRSNGYF